MDLYSTLSLRTSNALDALVSREQVRFNSNNKYPFNQCDSQELISLNTNVSFFNILAFIVQLKRK